MIIDNPAGQSVYDSLMNYGKDPETVGGIDAAGLYGLNGYPAIGKFDGGNYATPTFDPVLQTAADAGAGASTAKTGGLLDNFLTKKNADGTIQQGWGGMALGGLQGAANLFMGMKQYGLAKQQLADSEAHYNQQYAAQRQMTNTRMEDRQRARVSANPGGYESVDSYMKKNAIQ